MKKYRLIILILVFLGGNVQAQVDRTKKPEPGPAPVINMGEYEKFTLKNGLTVIVVKDDKLPTVAFSLVVDRDPVTEGDKTGYLNLVGQMMRSGTTNRTKAEIDSEIDYISGSLFPGSASLYAASLSKHQDKLLDLMSDVLFNPTFPEEELDKLKKQVTSGLTAEKDEPNVIANNVAQVLVYGKDHPYGELETEATVENISIEDIKNYYQTYFKPNVSYLAMVGDIDLKEAKKLANKYFAQWEKGEVPEHKYDMPKKPETTYVALVNRPNAVQTVVDITYPVDLKTGTEEAIKANVMNRILGGGSSGRLYKNIREDKGYTYGAYSSISSDELVGNFSANASVRTEVTDSSIVEFLAELKRMREEKVEDLEITLSKNEYAGGFIRALEDAQSIARFAINTERLGLPADYYKNYIKTIQSTTKDDVQKLAQKYVVPNNAYIVAVGKASEIAPTLEKFGKIQYYDMYGNEVDAPNFDMPTDVTADQVLNNYLDAIGGKETLGNVKSISIEMTASIPQAELSIVNKKKAPNKSLTEVSMGGNVLNKVIFDGEKGVQMAMGQKMPMDENAAADTKVSSAMFMEMELMENDIDYKLTGMEEVNGKNAYVVGFELPSGSSVSLLYDVETGLKLKQVTVLETPQGQMTQGVSFADYREVDGIMIPYSQSTAIGPQMIDAKVVSVEINEGIEDDVFAVE